MPIRDPSQRPEPKSACTGDCRPILRMSVAEPFATGSASTRSFHGLDAGKTGQPPIVGEPPVRVPAPADAVTATAARTATMPTGRMLGSIGRLAAGADRSDELAADRDRDGMRAVGGTEALARLARMRPGRLGADPEPLGDLVEPEPVREQREHLPFAPGQVDVHGLGIRHRSSLEPLKG